MSTTDATKISIHLTAEGKRKALRQTFEKAITIFSPLRDAVFDVYVSILVVTRYETVTREVGFFHVHNIVEEVPYQLEAITFSENIDGTANISSAAPEFDDATLWIAGQLEQVYNQINVSVNDPTKVGATLGWRCAYCGTLNQKTECSKCGAQRAW